MVLDMESAACRDECASLVGDVQGVYLGKV